MNSIFRAWIVALAVVASTGAHAQLLLDEPRPFSGFSSLDDAPAAPPPAPASPLSAPLAASPQSHIGIIKVSGNERIESDTVRSYITLEQGDLYDPAKANQTIKALFATGLFADVRVTREGADVAVVVRENPVISKVAFEGNKRLKDKDLEVEVRMKPRTVFTRAKVQADVERILELYRRNGRFSAKVEPKVIQHEQNRIDVVFEIDEGPVTSIKRIFFVGNDAYSSSKLMGVIRTEEAQWYRFFSSDDKYDPDRLAYDQELLRRYYMQRGYADFQVRSAVAELSPDKDGFYVTYTLNEGELYTFGDVKVENNLPDVNLAEIEKLVRAKKGEQYNSTLVEDSVDAIVKYLGDQGFAFVDVDPKNQRNKDTKEVNVTLIIGEGPRVYVERIDIHGNVRTLDKVIRREFRVAEGDPFNTSKLKRTEQRIKNLGYFENVKMKTEPGSAADRAKVDVEVEEKSTGELNFGAGFSSVDGLLADIGMKENNLLGRGQILKLRTTLATERQEIDLGFTEPYFMDKEVAAGFDLFRTRQDFRSQSSYDRESVGGVLRASYPITENLKHNVLYSLRTDDITNIRENASRFIRDQEGETTTSLVGHSFQLDKRDSRFDPTDGYYLKVTQDMAGLGGDVAFLRHEAMGSIYYPFTEKWVLRLAGSGGYIFGLGDDNVIIKDRFVIGGNNFRGFDKAGIGPRDRVTRDALGGNAYYTATVEQGFPLGLPEDLGFLGAFFVDVGNLWSIDATGVDIVDANTTRLSAGFGLFWRSPFGPIRIDIAYPLIKDEFDDEENINFSFGTRF